MSDSEPEEISSATLAQLVHDHIRHLSGDATFRMQVDVARRYGVEPDEVLYRWSRNSVAAAIALEALERQEKDGLCQKCGTHWKAWYLPDGTRAPEPEWVMEFASCIGCMEEHEFRTRNKDTMERLPHLKPEWKPNPNAKRLED